MGRFFFDIYDGVELRDDVGRDMEDGAILRAEALKAVTHLAAAEAEDARETTLVLTVRDEGGNRRLKVRLVCQVEEF
ncbi:DUF6894 family protein [Methylobacterium gnaphalii]|uniref:DUF6894 domain-containing protein n=1 Tax=Methylobacterium gnaphalii TaxID=1010610 RepID=A0A512JI33_9HYPH|nr:hypothetical protein [Methylobacterium gnaphalii]GEP09618.1 hypothetical protein MGN01_14630 [Methylobacterium gnaphalii]GJD67795.1 hypothetical protein MMMDOFMJ_0712 [Methylobacterium gnaphalii]GLS48589.1 hypothetical protein GCM10007885_14330 [Methylobacterium gnaphalii]